MGKQVSQQNKHLKVAPLAGMRLFVAVNGSEAAAEELNKHAKHAGGVTELRCLQSGQGPCVGGHTHVVCKRTRWTHPCGPGVPTPPCTRHVYPTVHAEHFEYFPDEGTDFLAGPTRGQFVGDFRAAMAPLLAHR